MSKILSETILYTTTSCCVCGVHFALSEDYDRARRGDHKSFYCPNGHPLSYTGPSEAEKRAQRLQREVEAAAAQAHFWRNEQERTKRQLISAKGQLTKTKRRVANGVCPCCDRSFVNVARHMATQHPDYTIETKD